jgi:error-prone DNA polymerase
MFLLFEDEWGTINRIVPRAVYERHRALARAEPLLLAHGRLERTAGETVRSIREAATAIREAGTGEIERVSPVVNVVVRELLALERFVASEDAPAAAQVHRLPAVAGVREQEEAERAASGAHEDAAAGAAVGAGLRAVAPAVQSFAAGRRR